MTQPRDLRALLGRIQDPALRLAAKVDAVHKAVVPLAAKGARVERGGLSLVFDRDPQIIRNRLGEVVGVDATIRAFRNANEIRLDQHRVFINPPTQVPDGGSVIVDGEERATYREDPLEAYLTALFESIETAPNPKGWRTRGTVTTVYADAGDGRVSSNNGTYATMLAGSSLNAATSGTIAGIGQEHVGGGTFYFGSQVFLGFDTSAIDDAATIDAATFSLYGVDKFTDKAHTLQARTYDYGASVTTADWRTGGGAGAFQALTLLATYALDATGSQWSTAGYNDFAESGSALRSAVNKTGTTYIVVCNNDFASGTAPTGNRQRVDCYMADQAGTTNDPKLVITSTTPPRAIPPSRPPHRYITRRRAT